MNKQQLMSVVSKSAYRSKLILQKNSPAILTVGGIVFIVGGTILACRATLKLDDILDDAEEEVAKIKSERTKGFDKTYRKDLTISYAQTCFSLVRVYGPAVTLSLTGIGCILTGHKILSSRNLAISAAYNLVEQSFSEYRERVTNELGDAREKEIRYNVKKEKKSVEEIGEDGKTKKVKKEVEIIDPNTRSQYARFFDETCSGWSSNPEYSLLFLKGHQNYANNLLQARGHVFLNEVLDALGLERTQAGAVVGWVLGAGDDFIDFGLYETTNRRFVNGLENVILLDFNVDGLIYDKI